VEFVGPWVGLVHWSRSQACKGTAATGPHECDQLYLTSWDCRARLRQ
jgi:hypothetical protein